jgi:hypothetical protein
MANVNKILPSLILASAGLFGSLQASAEFDNTSVAGRWAFSGDGTLVSTAEPVAMAGIMVFNPQGGCALAATINVGGVAYNTAAPTCRFSIGPGGRGSLMLQLAPEVPLPALNFSLVVVDDDDEEEIRAIGTGDLVANLVIKIQDNEDDDDDDEDDGIF